ncbi:hypothetical protein B0A55_00231 [Friedmanniomyces simplex]|uniref:BTB domain-containing protein n=1 Tax=Friedmanniomyces simplex TaxID=329884 RepID=A0A4U0Y1C8_9PEZI|nr:hypothetical protein B0A55_00231 [Friedmanniomyces simplex]
MALNVPQVRTNTVKRSGSSSSIGHSSIEHENDLAPVTPRSRRNSDSSVNASAAAPTAPGLIKPTTQHRTDKTTLYAGKNHKAVTLETKLLMEKSPYFKKLLSETPEPQAEQTTFEDADETALAMFGARLHGKHLHGPNDFHSTGHYLGLYALALKFGSEELANQVIDLIRAYYATGNLTAPPYRLQYIYTYTPTANPLRKFLVATAAWRALYGGEAGGGISDAMKEVLGADRALAGDFMQALVVLGRDAGKDPRRGGRCVWHLHEGTRKCEEGGVEPWED